MRPIRANRSSEAYLHYIRRQNPITEGASNVDQVRGTVTKAYEFALKECGNDRESGELWQEYIAFLADNSVNIHPCAMNCMAEAGL